ncbi:MAG TPA: hypothetical protein VGL62_15755 [Vicinamibacterales bacterium]|jgi:hypothetical protein
MGLFNWRRSNSARETGERLRAWRRVWTAALERRDLVGLAALEVEADERAAAGDDVEIEHEMLDAAHQVLALEAELERGALPHVETSHRVVGADACHFTAPVSMPDDAAQPSGRLLLSATRAIFVGGPRLVQIPWGAVREARQDERDIVVARGDQVIRFRCNTYGDALSGTAIAVRLLERARRI